MTEPYETTQIREKVQRPRWRKPRRSTSLVVVLTAMLTGGLLGWYSDDEVHADTGQSGAAELARASARGSHAPPEGTVRASPGMDEPPFVGSAHAAQEPDSVQSGEPISRSNECNPYLCESESCPR
jgi:hypothetical protein